MEFDKLHGVNLGGWLVLERWITPSVFHGTMAQDEYGLCRELEDRKAERLDTHRKTFITEDDFRWLKEQGMNAVRIPVPYWVFEDHGPYVQCANYLDLAFKTAEKLEIKIILSFHAAPSSQNGKDHSGHIGKAEWHTAPDNITLSLTVLEELMRRYGKSKALAGIGLLNEPGRKIPVRTLSDYYDKGYKCVRKECGESVAVIISDMYDFINKAPVFSTTDYKNLWFDTHLYQAFSWLDKRRSITKVLLHAKHEWLDYIEEIQEKKPLIIGEWSLGLDKKSFRGLDDFERDKALQAYGRLQQETFSNALGWFFWTYKTEDMAGWSLRDCVARGWFPPVTE
jgi:glucan 1,3-beta-glucosidase